MMSIIVDLDGTLCDDTHRQHLLQDKLWDEYHALCSRDTPHKDVELFCKMIGAFSNVELIALTGRTAKFMPHTLEWLARHKLDFDHLIMRPDDDFRKADEMKWGMLVDHFKSEAAILTDVLFMLENDERQIDFWRGKGINCWWVRGENVQSV